MFLAMHTLALSHDLTAAFFLNTLCTLDVALGSCHSAYQGTMLEIPQLRFEATAW